MKNWICDLYLAYNKVLKNNIVIIKRLRANS